MPTARRRLRRLLRAYRASRRAAHAAAGVRVHALARVHVHHLAQRQGDHGRLASAALRLRDDVAAGEDGHHRALLDGGRLFKAVRVQAAQQVLANAHRVKRGNSAHALARLKHNLRVRAAAAAAARGSRLVRHAGRRPGDATRAARRRAGQLWPRWRFLCPSLVPLMAAASAAAPGPPLRHRRAGDPAARRSSTPARPDKKNRRRICSGVYTRKKRPRSRPRPPPRSRAREKNVVCCVRVLPAQQPPSTDSRRLTCRGDPPCRAPSSAPPARPA
jgi:hypothetical protein